MRVLHECVPNGDLSAKIKKGRNKMHHHLTNSEPEGEMILNLNGASSSLLQTFDCQKPTEM